MLSLQHLMRPVLLSDENLWKNKKFVNGTREKRILSVSKMKDLIYSSQLSLKEKRKQKKNTHRKLKKLGLRKLSIRKGLLPKFRERELRFFVKCIKRGKMLRLREKEEILSKITLILAQQFMLQSLEMACHLTKRRINMKFSQKLFLHIKELKSLVAHFHHLFSHQK